MESFSYNISGELRESLEKIDALRVQIALYPVTVKTEIRLNWEAKLNKIYWSMYQENKDITKSSVTAVMTGRKKGLPSREDREVVSLKKTLEYIYFHFLGSEKEVSSDDLISIYRMLQSGGKLQLVESIISQFLKYLQVKKEHPVIQSGIAQIQMLRLHPYSKMNSIMSLIVSSVFLYKEGYDFRGLLVSEEYWGQNMDEYLKMTDSAKDGNITFFLEYYAGGIKSELEKVLKRLESLHFQTDVPASFFDLNDRQREILFLTDRPEARLTNRTVQQNFKVSQITASRDLAKLASLGLIFPHGKGRSVYYTKI